VVSGISLKLFKKPACLIESSKPNLIGVEETLLLARCLIARAAVSL